MRFHGSVVGSSPPFGTMSIPRGPAHLWLPDELIRASLAFPSFFPLRTITSSIYCSGVNPSR